MSIEIKLHPVQGEILRALLFKPLARFSELNLSGLSNDHFTFHIKKLLGDGLVEKMGMKYTLSTKGKEFANRMDTDTANLERQAKITVLVVGVHGRGNGTRYLVQQRLKQPYYGFYGYVSGKVRWGEEVGEAAMREFLEETGLSGRPKLLGIEHKLDVKEGVIQEDKFFYICRMFAPKGELVKDFEGGRNLWLTEDEIRGLTKVFGDMFDVLDVIKKGEFTFLEKKFEITEY
ncbi:NUDIX domain-containing protein [Candidatus Collierbacteria bacterium]|nr:NUDIX domain-containing protein [Candidatus Collierbacteria bacterium]